MTDSRDKGDWTSMSIGGWACAIITALWVLAGLWCEWDSTKGRPVYDDGAYQDYAAADGCAQKCFEQCVGRDR